MSLFQLIVVPSAAAAAVYYIVDGLRKRSRLVPGLLWGTIFAAVAVSVGFPHLPNMLAQSLGIGRGADLVLYGTTVSLILVVRWVYWKYRVLEQIQTELVRQLAIERARFGKVIQGDETGGTDRTAVTRLRKTA